MFDRYNLQVFLQEEDCMYSICDTWFASIDQLIKFINRFDNKLCSFNVVDSIYPDRFIDANDLLHIWRSNDE